MTPLDATHPRIRAQRERTQSLYALLVLPWLLGACEPLPDLQVTLAGERHATSERGDALDVRVQPKVRPAKPLEVYAESSNPREAIVVTGVLHFDASNWQTAQSLRIAGVDDDQADGDMPYTVDIFVREAGAPAARRWLIERIKLVNRDDDSASFEPLEDLPGGGASIRAAATSADGEVIVGQSEGELGVQAFRWADGRTTALSGADSNALAISPDGTQIVGSIADPSYESGHAAASFRVDGPAQALSAPPQPGPGTGPLYWFVSATVVLDDGTVFGTCHQYAAYGEPQGCRLPSKGSVAQVGGSFLYAADTAGHYAGTQNAARFAPFSSRPYLDGAVLPLPGELACPVNVSCTAELRALSDDATVRVGTASLPLPRAPLGGTLYPRAFVHTSAEGITLLPDLDGGELAAGAYAVSGDGRLVAGFGSDERGQQAVIWLDRDPRALADVLLEVGVELPEGWSLRELRAISRDGRVLIGNGVNPQGDVQAFRVKLPYLP